MTELFLDGYRVELGNAAIAKTYQINDLAEIENQQTNFTNRFQLPDTPYNVKLFEQLGIPGNTSRKAYQRIPAKLVEDGIELMSKGYATIKSYNGYYDVVIYDGNISLAETLKGKRINDLDYSALNHALSIDTFKASLDNDYQDGYIHALADFGKIGYYHFNVDYNPGAIFIAWLWDKIFATSGISYKGISTAQYPNGVFSKPKFLNSVVTPVRGFEVSLVPDSSIMIGSANTEYLFVNGSMSESGIQLDTQFDFQTPSLTSLISFQPDNELRFNYDGLCKLNISASLDFYSDTQVEQFQMSISIRLNGYEIFNLYEGHLSVIDQTIQVKLGDVLTVHVNADVYPVNIQGSEYGWYSLNANANLSFTQTIIQNEIDYKTIMPDKSQLEFVKDIMQRFGLLFRKVRNKDEFEFIEIEELLNNRANAEDWSDKFISRSESYEVGEYARKNRFAYEYDEGVEAFADGIMSVDNEIIEGEKTLFTSIFRASKVSRKINNINVYSIPLWEKKEDSDGTVTYEIKDDSFRIFEITRRQATVYIKQDVSSNTVSIPDTPGDDVPFLDFSLCNYQNYVNTFFRTFNKVLDNSNKIDAEILLDPVDVYNLDFFRLKYIEQLGRYYYLNKVSNFKNGKTTKCELIEVREFYFNSPPTVVGNNQKSIAHIATYTFTWADFIFNTIPAYYDPDGDVATHIKVSQLFDRADLKLDGNAVLLNQEIAKADIDAGLLQATAVDIDPAFSTDMKFKVKSENNEGFSIPEGTFTLNVAARVNTAPVVNVGNDAIVWLPANSHAVSGASVTDDKGTPTLLWTKRSGGAANISNPATLTPTFLNLQKGNYVFRLTANDVDGASAYDEMIVRVWSDYTNISIDNPTISNSTTYLVTIQGEANTEVTLEVATDENTSGEVDFTFMNENETKTLIKTLDATGQITFDATATVQPGDYGIMTIRITAISAGIIGTDYVELWTGSGV